MGELQQAGADPDRVLVVEVSPAYPVTFGHGDDPHRLHVDDIDVLVTSDRSPFLLTDPPTTDADRAIAEHAARFVTDGCTIQTGIGGVPSAVVSLLADGPASTSASTPRCSPPRS